MKQACKNKEYDRPFFKQKSVRISDEKWPLQKTFFLKKLEKLNYAKKIGSKHKAPFRSLAAASKIF